MTDQLRQAAQQALEQLDFLNACYPHKTATDTAESLRSALAAAPQAEPVAWLFQHEETGLTQFVCPQQVEWGFEANNPRWKKIAPAYTHPAPAADVVRDAERYRWLRGNYSGSLELAQAINAFTPDELDAAIDAAMKGADHE